MPPLRRFAVPVVLLLAVAGPARAQSSPEEVAKAVRDLGSPKFAVREKASALIWAAGQEGELALLRALPGADLETAKRAQRVLDKFRWGIYPDTPKEILSLIAKYRSGNDADRTTVVHGLFARGPAQYRLIARLLAAEKLRGGRVRVAQGFFHKDVETALRTRLRAHAFDGLEDLLAIRLMSGEEKPVRDYALFLHLRGGLDRAIAYYSGYAALPEENRAAYILAHLHRVKGDLPAARRAAEQAGDADLLQGILVEQGDWKTLSERAERLAGEEALDDFKMFYHRRAGNGPALEQAVTALVKAARAKKPDDGTLWWEAKSLFLNDRSDEALALLEDANDHRLPWDVLVRQRRVGEAMRLLDRFRSHDGHGKAWAAVRRAKLLLHLGERDAALKVLDGVREEVVQSMSPWLQTDLLRAEREAGRDEEALRLCVRLMLRPPPPQRQPSGSHYTPAAYTDHLLSELFKQDGASARPLWLFLSARSPRVRFLGWDLPRDPLATLRRLRDLLDGKLPAEEFAALVREARTAALKLTPAERDERLAGLVKICRAGKDEDLLRECLETAAEVRVDSAGAVQLARYLFGKQRWAEAARVCARERRREPENAVLALLHAHALTQLGRAEDGKRLTEAARRLPLADDAGRHAFAEALAELGRHDEARREFTLLTHCGYRSSWYTRNAWRKLSQYALRDGDDLQAAACWERWYLGVIGRGSFFLENEPYVTVPYRLHFWRARGLLARGDGAAVRAEIAVCERLLPGETDTAIAFVPALARRGLTREADELFDRTFASWRSLCKQYPRCARFHNGLGWLGARCRRQLDAALEHGRQAVRLAPDNAGYLDTLAEVHFQRGENAEAVRLMRRCIELAPGRDYYQRQLKRFEAGDRSAKLPE
jgi:tetratricopeptide (TPR) repeat protein